MFFNAAKIVFAAALGSGCAAAMSEQARIPIDASVADAQRTGPQSTSPALGWRGVERLVILCQATSEVVVENDAVVKALCLRVQAAAQRGAPVPVEIVGYGHADLQSPRAAVLFIQAAVVEVAPSRTGLILTARVERNGADEEARTYFGATPRLAPFQSAAHGGAWDRAIAASLSEVLPWVGPADRGDVLPRN